MMNSYIYVYDELSRRYIRIRQLVYVYIDEIQPTLTVYIYRRIRIYRCTATYYLQRTLAHMYTTNSLVDVPVSLIHMYTYTYVYIYTYILNFRLLYVYIYCNTFTATRSLYCNTPCNTLVHVYILQYTLYIHAAKHILTLHVCCSKYACVLQYICMCVAVHTRRRRWLSVLYMYMYTYTFMYIYIYCNTPNHRRLVAV